jgi:hypothetical protein
MHSFEGKESLGLEKARGMLQGGRAIAEAGESPFVTPIQIFHSSFEVERLQGVYNVASKAGEKQE